MEPEGALGIRSGNIYVYYQLLNERRIILIM